MKFNLVEQVAEFFNEGLVGCWVVCVERFDGINYFIRFFDQMFDQLVVCLLAIPRALLAQCASQLM